MDYKGWGDPKKNIKYSPNDVLNNPKKYKTDYSRIINADIKYPIIITNDIIVDGVHRLTKAQLLNKKYIKAHIFNDKQMSKFLIGNNKNWEKIDKLQTYDFIKLFNERFCA